MDNKEEEFYDKQTEELKTIVVDMIEGLDYAVVAPVLLDIYEELYIALNNEEMKKAMITALTDSCEYLVNQGWENRH